MKYRLVVGNAIAEVKETVADTAHFRALSILPVGEDAKKISTPLKRDFVTL